MDLICDTNVWYDINAGTRNVAVLKGTGHRLLATAINILEIVSKIDEQNLTARKGAAEMMLKHADDFLDAPDYHVGRECGLTIPNLPFTWREVCQAISTAKDVAEIINGVEDYEKMVSRRVDVPGLKSWRSYVYDKWERDIIKAIDSEFPNYAKARAKRKSKQMNKANATKLIAKLESPAAQLQIIRSVVVRISAEATALPKDSSTRQLERYVEAILPYSRAYAYYLHMAASVRAPQPNDRGDIDAFLYLQGDRRLLTSETDWIELGKRSGMEDLFLDPEAV